MSCLPKIKSKTLTNMDRFGNYIIDCTGMNQPFLVWRGRTTQFEQLSNPSILISKGHFGGMIFAGQWLGVIPMIVTEEVFSGFDLCRRR